MSVGQGKALRAHQHKMNRVTAKTNSKVADIKERSDAKKALAKKRALAISSRARGGPNG